MKELLEQCGVEHEPATEATPRMFGIMVTTSIPKRFNLSPFLVARERIQVVCEGVGGCRIGEVAGGGEGHGLLANETCLVEDPAAVAGGGGHRGERSGGEARALEDGLLALSKHGGNH